MYDSLSEGARHNKSIPFFATKEFLGIHNFEGKILSSNSRNSEAIIQGYLESNTFISPFKNSFGGFFNLNLATIEADINNFLIEFTNLEMFDNIKLTLPSSHMSEYYPDEQLQALLKIGGNITFSDNNFVIDTKNWDEKNMSKGNRKKLRQCINCDLKFQQLDIHSLKEIHDLIRINRENLGAKISISLDALYNSFEAFPDKYFSFGVFDKRELIAGAVTVRNSINNLYVFLWADSNSIRPMSPITLLCAKLIDFAKTMGIRFLDLGTSSLNGVSIEGLTRFKVNLGAVSFPKISIDVNLQK